LIAAPLDAWLYGGLATSSEPCGGLAGPGSEGLPKRNVSRSPSGPDATLKSVNLSDGRAPAGGSAQAATEGLTTGLGVGAAVGATVGAAVGGTLAATEGDAGMLGLGTGLELEAA